MTYPTVGLDGIPLWTKDPDETITRGLDWSQYLSQDETILAAAWTIPAGISGTQIDQFAAKRSMIRLVGGTLGNTYNIACMISTSAADSPQRSIRIAIRAK